MSALRAVFVDRLDAAQGRKNREGSSLSPRTINKYRIVYTLAAWGIGVRRNVW